MFYAFYVYFGGVFGLKVVSIMGNETLARPPAISRSNPSENLPKASYREVITYDSNGEVLHDSTSRVVSKNGRGFVLSYSAKMIEFITKVTSAATLRVFMFIAHHQGYGSDGVYGYRCTRQYLADTLGLTRRSVYTALEFLMDNFLVNEIRVSGVYEYMINPDYVTIGTDKKTRMKEWSQRWEFYWKRKHDSEMRHANYRGGKNDGK